MAFSIAALLIHEIAFSATAISIIHGRLEIYFLPWYGNMGIICGSNNLRNSNSQSLNFYNSWLWQKHLSSELRINRANTVYAEGVQGQGIWMTPRSPRSRSRQSWLLPAMALPRTMGVVRLAKACGGKISHKADCWGLYVTVFGCRKLSPVCFT